MQKQFLALFTRIALLVCVLPMWLWVMDQPFASHVNLGLIVGGVLLVYPVVWLGRILLDANPTLERAIWITIFVHYAVGGLFGMAIIRALATQQDWAGWQLPVPTEIGLALVYVTGAATVLTVINLALRGLGAPFAIALSRKLAIDWLYAWTRNPMVLAALAWLVALGIWFQSTLFVVWALILVAPAILVFVKVYEERELEIRFGAAYREYKARTPLLLPRKPQS